MSAMTRSPPRVSAGGRTRGIFGAASVTLNQSGCQGFCQMGPLVSVLPDNILYTRVRAEDVTYLEPWAKAWYRCCAGLFLHSYRQSVAGAPFMPKKREEVAVMLSAFMLDKALYELGYELNHRPEWVRIPLTGIRRMLP